MQVHFGETFHLVLPEDMKTLKRFASGFGCGNCPRFKGTAWKPLANLFASDVPMDSVKPMDKRKGWTARTGGGI